MRDGAEDKLRAPRCSHVLEDCRRVLDWLEADTDETVFRIHWVALCALLRTVGDVLMREAADAGLKTRAAEMYRKLKDDRPTNAIYWDFIVAERNNILKEYKLGYAEGDACLLYAGDDGLEQFTADDCLFKPFIREQMAQVSLPGVAEQESHIELEDVRDLAEQAIAWWECKINEVFHVGA